MNTNLIPNNFNNFDHDRALEMLYLIQQAHHQFAQAQQQPTFLWEQDLTAINVNGKKYKILANFGFAHYLFLKRKRVPFGFIAQRQDTQDIYVVFRGTANLAEWISNFKFVQQSYKQANNPPLCPTIPRTILGEVHRGFYKTYIRPDLGNLIDRIYDFNRDDNYNSIRDTIEKTLSNCPANSRVFVTGHSLGGALATIATLHIHLSERIPIKSPILYSFASPRVGDMNFARNFDNLECYRIANSEDIVPKIPMPCLLLSSASLPGQTGATVIATKKSSRFDYEHIGIPIYFTLQTGRIPNNHILPAYFQALQAETGIAVSSR
ncbi:lipase class 3 [Calothrix sp. NIES-4071]|nr:lipase class 3 [Calothrix sp. NIES-4071]BAZ58716.1 lipase class 3 [Calothrix sp. NIES-4105]